ELQAAGSEVEIGMRDDSAELRDVDHPGTEDIAVEGDRPGGVGDGEEGRERGRPVRTAVSGVRSGQTGLRDVHDPTVGGRAAGRLGDSRQMSRTATIVKA